MLIQEVLDIKGVGETFTVAPEAPVEEAVRRLMEHGIGSLVVMRGDDLVGYLTERDILRGLHTRGGSLVGVMVEALMERQPLIASPDDSVDYARDVMTKNRVSHLIVHDGTRLVGVISFHDVARASLKEANFENALLKRYIKHWPE